MSSRRPITGRISMDPSKATNPQTMEALAWLRKSRAGKVKLCLVVVNEASHDGAGRDSVSFPCEVSIPFTVSDGCLVFDNDRCEPDGNWTGMFYTSSTTLRAVSASLSFHDEAGRNRLTLGLPYGAAEVLGSAVPAQVPDPGDLAEEITSDLKDTRIAAVDDADAGYSYERTYDISLTSQDGAITTFVKFDTVGKCYRADNVPDCIELPKCGPVDLSDDGSRDSPLSDLPSHTRVILMDACVLHDLEIRGA